MQKTLILHCLLFLFRRTNAMPNEVAADKNVDELKLDKRLVRCGFEINGQIKVYENLAIVAKGTKYANSNSNTCEVSIANLDRDTRNYLLTECSPFNKNNKKKQFFIEVGRESYGYFRLFEGDFAYCALGQSINVKEDKPDDGKKKKKGKPKKTWALH